MKLSGLISPHPLTLERMADRLDAVHDKKRKDTSMLVKMLRAKANRRGRTRAGADKYVERGTADSFAGYMNDTFAQSTWR